MIGSRDHWKLTNGKGSCSVPMWQNGLPAGFCNDPAFGEPDEYGRLRYDGYVPCLACYGHGGPRCPGIEIEPGVFSGCDQSAGDCPVCGK